MCGVMESEVDKGCNTWVIILILPSGCLEKHNLCGLGRSRQCSFGNCFEDYDKEKVSKDVQFLCYMGT
jgi:hypothetical protein